MTSPGSATVSRRRLAIFSLAVIGGFAAVIGQLIHFGLEGQARAELNAVSVTHRSTARPDIVDRNGRLLATDIVSPSLFADPAQLLDPEAAAFALAEHLPEVGLDRLRRLLSNRERRFVWIARRLTPAKAQAIHNLGIHGLDFRNELHRVYPAGNVASHLLGTVSVDNIGTLGIERFIETDVGTDKIEPPGRSPRSAVALSIDLAAQHALRSELTAAMARHEAKAVAALVMDVGSGEIVAASSLPDFDPNHSAQSLEADRLDRLTRGRYELGSVFKTLTIAAALEENVVTLADRFDARQPLKVGNSTIHDDHAQNRILTVQETFLKSSNIATAQIADKLGSDRMLGFFSELGLVGRLETELGPVAAPDLPERWAPLNTMTIGYGHGIAVAPIQFAAAAATLFNGGHPVSPTFLRISAEDRRAARRRPVLSLATVGTMRGLMRLNVSSGTGTGTRGDVEGYEIGGKTGTAEIPGPRGYQRDKVIASFLSIFPASQPKYLALVMLFEPQSNAASGNSRGAGRTAAPTTARIIERLGPIVGLLPATVATE